MTELDIPPEIWGHILAFLRKPIPAVLSNPPRSDLRHPALCYAVRVCKMFYPICLRLLYTHLVTDNLPLLFAQLDPLESPSPDLSRFAYTQSLRIEYADYSAGLSLEVLMTGGEYAWDYYGATEACGIEIRKSNAGADTKRLRRLLWFAKERRMVTFLPQLRTVAVCCLYSPDDIWSEFEKEEVPGMVGTGEFRHTHIFGCNLLFEQFLMTGNLTHLCSRDKVLAPLSLPDRTYASRHGHVSKVYNPLYTRISHLGLTSKRCPFPMGVPYRIISEYPSDMDNPYFYEDIVNIHFPAILARDGHPSISESSLNTAQFELFLSSSQYTLPLLDPCGVQLGFPVDFTPVHNNPAIPWSVERQREVVNSIGEAVQAHMRKHSPYKETVRWFPSGDAPKCPCCGTLPPA